MLLERQSTLASIDGLASPCSATIARKLFEEDATCSKRFSFIFRWHQTLNDKIEIIGSYIDPKLSKGTPSSTMSPPTTEKKERKKVLTQEEKAKIQAMQKPSEMPYDDP